MGISFSSAVLRGMGFNPLLSGEYITASFTCISVYEARGITIKGQQPETASGSLNGVSYRISIGPELNETCLKAFGDVYTDDEAEWKKENRSSGPFVFIQFGPTDKYTISSAQKRTEEDGSITTLESFPTLGNDLGAMEKAALPELVTALTCLLSGPDRNVQLRKLDRTSVGKTSDGKVIHDIRFQLSATGYASQGLHAGVLSERLQAAVTVAPRLNKRAARFFALGLGEEDDFKKFLYFFLSLEVHTHAVYGQIGHAEAVKRILNQNMAAEPALVDLMHRQVGQLRRLYDRFVWNTACTWKEITAADVALFKQLKDARDAIAHGAASEPPQGHASLAERLARKVLAQ